MISTFINPSIHQCNVPKLSDCRVKELCIRRHFGGFALHEGYAYFRLSSPEDAGGGFVVLH